VRVPESEFYGGEAVARAAAEHVHPTRDWTRDCQMFVRTRYGVGPGSATARLGWLSAENKHTSYPPPAAVPVYFWMNNIFWHATITADHSANVWSNDILRRGKIDKVGIGFIESRWGARYLGWTEEINGVQVYDGRTVIDISNVIYAVRNGTHLHNGPEFKKAVAAEVGKGQMNLDSHVMGGGVKTQIGKLQEKWYGFHTGIPGPKLIVKLCDKHGMKAIA